MTTTRRPAGTPTSDTPTKVSLLKTCRFEWDDSSGEYTGICARPLGHPTTNDMDHDLVDTMGLCLDNDNCRAARGGFWSSTGHEHNHPTFAHETLLYS